MEKFVCVRVVQGWGLDLSLFQFDNELTWAVFFTNADKTIYGRYGTRSEHKDATKDVSLEGFKKALQGALELHGGYPANKKELAGKTGPSPAWRTPESIPALAGKPNVKPADGTRAGCVHCHQAYDSEVWTLRGARQPVTDRLMYPYPMPDRAGFSLDPKERAVVASVAEGSPAAKAGLKAGDRVVKLDGQPILSTADVQWVLHNAKEPGSLKAELDRDGKKVDASIALAAGWRTKDEIWRVIVWSMRHKLLGTEPLEVLGADDRKKAGAPSQGMALRVKGFPPDWVKEKNLGARNAFQAGDVIVDVDGRKAVATESDLLAYLMQRKAGQAADFTVMRGGKAEKVKLAIP